MRNENIRKLEHTEKALFNLFDLCANLYFKQASEKAEKAEKTEGGG